MSLSKWRGSASLVIAARNQLAQSKAKKNTDYRVLMVERPLSGKFASTSVFPGGMHEAADESLQWLQLFHKFGVPNEKIKELIGEGKSRPSVFAKANENTLHREISLRIAALREAFEEVGLLIFREQNCFENSSSECACVTVHKNFDCAHWQKQVHNDASKFINLFKELQLLPDLWSLHEWSTWMSPSSYKHKFQTVLYMVGLDETPQLTVDATELLGSNWRTPQEHLNEFHNQKIMLPPPQFYELARLCNFQALNGLLKFAQDRANEKGMVLLLGIHYQCTDGTVFVLPGDDMYVDNPSTITGAVKTNQKMEDFRQNTTNFNRVEWTDRPRVLINVPFTDGQMAPKYNLLESRI